MGNQHTYGARSLFIAIACVCAFACGDDDAPVDAGTDSEVGSGGRGGRGGASAGTGGRGGRGGTGGTAGRGPTGGTGMMMECTEEPSDDPVTCGGQTCMAPTFDNNSCVVACCVELNGAEVCGAKSTNAMFPTECELPAVEDPSCPDLEAQGTPLEGCCNVAQGKCGIISTLRPGCITSSTLVDFPDPLQDCSPPMDDAGTEDAGI